MGKLLCSSAATGGGEIQICFYWASNPWPSACKAGAITLNHVTDKSNVFYQNRQRHQSQCKPTGGSTSCPLRPFTMLTPTAVTSVKQQSLIVSRMSSLNQKKKKNTRIWGNNTSDPGGSGGIQWRHLRPEGAAVNETSNLSFAPSFSKPTQLEVEKTCLPLTALLASICYLQMRHVETPACSGETRGLGALPPHLQRQR